MGNNGHLVCFQLLALLKNAVMDNFYTSFVELSLISLGYLVYGSRIARS